MRNLKEKRVCTTIALTVVLAPIGYKYLTFAAPFEVQAAHRTTIPAAGPLASPKSLEQMGVPVEATRAAVPEDNPQTPEKIALGEQLFFDGRLSVDGTVACSTCHDPALAFTDGKSVSIGVKGRAGQRNSPTILNALYDNAQFWDGRVKTLEDQAALPIIHPSEMGQPSLDAAVAKIIAIPEYEQAFRRVFGRAVNQTDLVRALASYERTQFSFDSPFDHFIAGDKSAISDSAIRGWDLFNTKARCNKCHALSENKRDPIFFTDKDFHNIGIGIIRHNVVALACKAEQEIDSGKITDVDQAAIQAETSVVGRFLVTKGDRDIASFKTPIFRNVLITAPYFHDGSQATLWDVLDHYNHGDGIQDPWLDEDIQPLALSEREIDDVVAFLAALTSSQYQQIGAKELARQRTISRTHRPERDTARAFGSKPVQLAPRAPVFPRNLANTEMMNETALWPGVRIKKTEVKKTQYERRTLKETHMTDFRKETDSLGVVEVPADKLWGAQTQRSLEHFSIGKDLIPREMITAYAILKKGAANANLAGKRLDQKRHDLIVQVCDEILAGQHHDMFPLHVWMTGSGTQFNMNVNEVISNRCSQIAGTPLGSKTPVHPNDHVNMAQSSNDSFPSAMNIAGAVNVKQRLIPAVQQLRDAIGKKAHEWDDIVKIGRTHMQDATPLTLGQEWSGYEGVLSDDLERIEGALNGVYRLALGGTAVGTGINSAPGFAEDAAAEIAKLTGLPFVTAPNKFTVQGAHDAQVQLSGTLRTLAVSLYKIANDIRLMSCGPRAGFAELNIPENEPGSSIMPGKVNPTQAEALAMVAVQVMANDTAVGFGGAGGYLEMNVYKPLIIYNVTHSTTLLADSCTNFRIFLVEGTNPNLKKINKYVEESLMLVTALSPVIGYDKASKIAHYANDNDLTLKAAALKLGYVTEAEFDRVVDPKKMVRAYVATPAAAA